MNIALTLLFCLISLSEAFAVDGYKDFKFGMSKGEVKKLYAQSLYEQKMEEISGHVTVLCSDQFLFGESKTNIFFYFVDGKLLRVAIQISLQKVSTIGKSLSEKYGVPCSSSGQDSLENVDTMPNAKAFIKWDNDTVVLLVASESDATQTALLIYTVPNYEDQVMKKQQTELKDSI